MPAKYEVDEVCVQKRRFWLKFETGPVRSWEYGAWSCQQFCANILGFDTHKKKEYSIDRSSCPPGFLGSVSREQFLTLVFDSNKFTIVQ